MLEPRHNEGPGDWLNWFAIKRFPYIEVLFVRHIEVFVARDQAPHCAKKEKNRRWRKKKKSVERSEPIGSLGSGTRPFPLPRIPLGSLHSPIFSYLTPFFAFPRPPCGAWSQAKVFVIEDRYIKVSLYVPGGTTSFPAMIMTYESDGDVRRLP